jgi:hypothetical protein
MPQVFASSPLQTRALVATQERGRRRRGRHARFVLGAAAFGSWLLSAAACGNATGDENVDTEPAGCTADEECSVGQVCEAAVCVDRLVVITRPAGPLACSVLSCPSGDGECCSAAAASATGNRRQDYESYLHMVRAADSVDGQVRADFRFDAPNQQGWLTFELAQEMDIRRLQFFGWHEGVADRFLSVNTNQADGGGCAFAFDLEWRPNPNPESEGGPQFVLGRDMQLDSDAFCYGGGEPGRATELAFAVFSTQPGPASLIISNIRINAD